MKDVSIFVSFVKVLKKTRLEIQWLAPKNAYIYIYTYIYIYKVMNHSTTSMTFAWKTSQNQSKLKTVHYGQYYFLHLNISKLFFCLNFTFKKLMYLSFM
jgi:hypothetical protein